MDSESDLESPTELFSPYPKITGYASPTIYSFGDHMEFLNIENSTEDRIEKWRNEWRHQTATHSTVVAIYCKVKFNFYSSLAKEKKTHSIVKINTSGYGDGAGAIDDLLNISDLVVFLEMAGFRWIAKNYLINSDSIDSFRNQMTYYKLEDVESQTMIPCLLTDPDLSGLLVIY